MRHESGCGHPRQVRLDPPARGAEAVGRGGSRGSRRPGARPPRRRRRDRQGDQRRRVRRPAAGPRLPDPGARELRARRGRRRRGHRTFARRRRGVGPASRLEPLRRDRASGHDDRRFVFSSAGSTCSTAFSPSTTSTRRLSRESAGAAEARRRPDGADERGRDGDRPGLRDPASAPRLASAQGGGSRDGDARADRLHDPPAAVSKS